MSDNVFPDLREILFLDDVKRWIESGGSPHVVRSESGSSLLHIAAEFQCVEAIEYLIALNIIDKIVKYIGSPDHCDATALH